MGDVETSDRSKGRHKTLHVQITSTRREKDLIFTSKRGYKGALGHAAFMTSPANLHWIQAFLKEPVAAPSGYEFSGSSLELLFGFLIVLLGYMNGFQSENVSKLSVIAGLDCLFKVRADAFAVLFEQVIGNTHQRSFCKMRDKSRIHSMVDYASWSRALEQRALGEIKLALVQSTSFNRLSGANASPVWLLTISVFPKLH